MALEGGQFGRRGCAGAALAALAAALLSCRAATAAEVNIVLSGEEAPYAVAKDAARELLSARGHAVRVSQLAEAAKEVSAAAGRKADVYLAVGTKAALALGKLVKPPARLVYCMVSAPEKAGLGGATGVSMDVPMETQMALITQAISGLKVIGVLYRSDSPASAALVKELERVKPKEVRVLSVAVDKHASVAAAIEAMLNDKPDIVWTAPDTAVYDTAAVRALLLASVRRKVPVFGFSTAAVKAGALLGVGIDPRSQGEQAAGLVVEGLKPPATGPSATTAASRQGKTVAPQSAIAVNLIVAERISVSLPAELVEKATHVFRPESEKQ